MAENCTVCGTTRWVDNKPNFPCPNCKLIVCNWHAGMNLCCRLTERKDEEIEEIGFWAQQSKKRNYKI